MWVGCVYPVTMGDRAQIHIEDNGVKLYTHWDAQNAAQVVARALGRSHDRWNDPPYLARVIFQDLVGDDDGITNYGIGTRNTHTRIDIYVNCADQNVRVEEWGEVQDEATFDEFEL